MTYVCFMVMTVANSFLFVCFIANFKSVVLKDSEALTNSSRTPAAAEARL